MVKASSWQAGPHNSCSSGRLARARGLLVSLHTLVVASSLYVAWPVVSLWPPVGRAVLSGAPRPSAEHMPLQRSMCMCVGPPPHLCTHANSGATRTLTGALMSRRSAFRSHLLATYELTLAYSLTLSLAYCGCTYCGRTHYA